MTERQVFSDLASDKTFKEQGYLVTRLLDIETVENLKRLVHDSGFKTTGESKKKLGGINVSLYDNRIDVRENFFNEVWKTIELKLKGLVENYEPAMINFWSKVPGGGSLELHQNWTHVDENKFISMSLWIPLQPTRRRNGTIELVPRSQQKISGIRGPGIEHVFRDIQQEIIANYLVPINLEVGEVVFLDDSIIHYTGHNTDMENSRDSIQVLLKPIEAPALFFVGDKKDTGNTVKCYEVERNFFSNLVPGRLERESIQHAKLLKTFTKDFHQLSMDEFKRMLSN